MDHMYDYLLKKGDKASAFLENAEVTITLKVDGTPMQMSVDGERCKFYKKGTDPKKPGKELTPMDLYTNVAFAKPKAYLESVVQSLEGKNLPSLMNFEIIRENEHHLVQYKRYPKENLCLLSAFNNDNKLSQDEIVKLSQRLGVDTVPVIFIGKLGKKAMMLKKYVIDNCNPNSPVVDKVSFKDHIFKIIGVPVNTDHFLFDTHNGAIEGFVFDFKNEDGSFVTLKVDDPYFCNTLRDNKKKEMPIQDKQSILNLVKLITREINKGELCKMSDDLLTNLIENFDHQFGSNRDVLKRIAMAARNSGKVNLACDVSAIPEKWRSKMRDKDYADALRTFTWLFMKKRTGMLSDVNDYVEQMLE